MVFAHDANAALQAAAALINTAGEEPDGLQSIDELDAFVQQWRWTGSRTGDAAEVEQVRALRPRLREVWAARDEEQVEGVNALLREAGALPQLVRHDEWDWHLHATRDEQPLAQRMAVEAAMALVDVIREGQTERVRGCAASDCDNVLIDLSRNGSKRYCDAGCGNRLAAKAYRARLQG